MNIMGHIKEPAGVVFTVDTTPLTTEERLRLSEIIAHYKTTGKKLPFHKLTMMPRKRKLRIPETKL